MTMTEISAEQVKALRELTGAGMMDCKRALQEAGGDMARAEEILKTKGLASVAKRADRSTGQGRVDAYVHFNNTVGVLIEVDCETDFVARTEDFVALAKDLALHIAAMNPRYLRPEDVPAAEIEASGETAEKFYEQHVLLAQPFVKDGSQTIEDKIKSTVAKLRENVVVRRFVRYEIGG